MLTSLWSGLAWLNHWVETSHESPAKSFMFRIGSLSVSPITWRFLHVLKQERLKWSNPVSWFKPSVPDWHISPLLHFPPDITHVVLESLWSDLSISIEESCQKTCDFRCHNHKIQSFPSVSEWYSWLMCVRPRSPCKQTRLLWWLMQHDFSGAD